MLEENNLVLNYFDNVCYKEVIDYIKNKVDNHLDQTINSNTTSSYNNYCHSVSIHLCSLIENLQKYLKNEIFT